MTMFNLAKELFNDVLTFDDLVIKPPLPSISEAAGPRMVRARPLWGELPRSYLVMMPWEIEVLTPEVIQVMNVTETIPKGNKGIGLAYCKGVAHNYFMYHRQKMQVKLCEVGSGQDPGVIDLDPAVGSSKMLDPIILAGLMNSPSFKAVVSASEADNLTDLMDRVGEYAGTEFGEEKKAKYLEMVETLTSNGLGDLGRFDRVVIWQMLTLKDRVMKAMMNSFQLGGFVKTPIAIDIPLASADNHVTPWALGWKAGCSAGKGLKPARPCNIPDLNLLAQEEEEATVGEEEENNAKKRKAGEEAQDEVPKTAD